MDTRNHYNVNRQMLRMVSVRFNNLVAMIRTLPGEGQAYIDEHKRLSALLESVHAEREALHVIDDRLFRQLITR